MSLPHSFPFCHTNSVTLAPILCILVTLAPLIIFRHTRPHFVYPRHTRPIDHFPSHSPPFFLFPSPSPQSVTLAPPPPLPDNALEEQKLVLQLGTEVYTLQANSMLQPELSRARSGMQELMALSEFGSSSNAMLGVVAGVLKRESVISLERVIFRATRGNAIFQKSPIERSLLDLDAKAGAPQLVDKTFFMVFFAGDVLRDKISKICTYFGATLYRYPDSGVEHAEMSIQVKNKRKRFAPSLPQCRTPHLLPHVQHVFQNSQKHTFCCAHPPFFALTQVESRLVESEEVLGRANRILMETLERVAACYGSWSLSVIKEKMIFDALNKCEFDIKRHVFVAEGWVPKKRCFFRPPHPFLPHVAPHFSHISPFILVLATRPSCAG